MMGIYKITNKINNKCYIGQSTNIKERWTDHRTNKLPKDKHYHLALYCAFRKYGLENFTFEVLEECTKDELHSREQYYIAKYDSFKNGYNETIGGDSTHNFVKINQDILDKIVNDIINTKIPFIDIANKYNITPDMCTRINQGHSWYNPDLTYPLRITKVKQHYCINCGNPCYRCAKLCDKCSRLYHRKVVRPSREIFIKDLYELGFVKTAEKYGMARQSLVWWCKDYNIPHRVKEFKNWYIENIL